MDFSIPCLSSPPKANLQNRKTKTNKPIAQNFEEEEELEVELEDEKDDVDDEEFVGEDEDWLGKDELNENETAGTLIENRDRLMQNAPSNIKRSIGLKKSCVHHEKTLERRRNSFANRRCAQSLVGTPNYIAPEILRRQGIIVDFIGVCFFFLILYKNFELNYFAKFFFNYKKYKVIRI